MTFDLNAEQLYFSRRDFMRGLGVLLLAACAPLNMPAYADEGLGPIVRRQNKLFGAAVQSKDLTDKNFTSELKREVTLLVPESELKWAALRPSPTQFDFSAYHRIAAFAQTNNMDVRGHTLVWHRANPSWLTHTLTKTNAEKILRTHITRVMQETAPLISNWDVVNEAIDPFSSRPDGLRASPWLKALGPDYIPLAFQAAHAANPSATLVYNDYGAEYGDGNGMQRRAKILQLLRTLKSNNVPIHALGLQSHLQCHRPLGGPQFTDFLQQVRALDIEIYVTELDLDTRSVPGAATDKITAASIYLRTYLEMLQQDAPLDMLLTWGLTDRHSWLRQYAPHLTGMLPLDAKGHRTKMWEILRDNWAEEKA